MAATLINVRRISNFLFRCDLTCHSQWDASIRDWQLISPDGIAQENGHGLVDGMPMLGICTVEAEGHPLPIAFCRVSRLDRLTF